MYVAISLKFNQTDPHTLRRSPTVSKRAARIACGPDSNSRFKARTYKGVAGFSRLVGRAYYLCAAVPPTASQQRGVPSWTCDSREGNVLLQASSRPVRIPRSWDRGKLLRCRRSWFDPVGHDMHGKADGKPLWPLLHSRVHQTITRYPML